MADDYDGNFTFEVDLSPESKKILKKLADMGKSVGGGAGGLSGGKDMMEVLERRYQLDKESIVLASKEQQLRSKNLIAARKELKNMDQKLWKERELMRNIDRMIGQFGAGSLSGGLTQLAGIAMQGAGAGISKGVGGIVSGNPLLKFLTDPSGARKIASGETQETSPAFPLMQSGKERGMMGALNGRTMKRIMESSVGQKLSKHTEKMSKVLGSDGAKGIMGGMAGGAVGIGGSLITKAIEASPIAQAMMKMMSTAFTLILRPIGDFFGGFFKPISIRLLKWGAENVGAGAGMFKMGQEAAAHLIGFISDPAAYLTAAILTGVEQMMAHVSDFFSPLAKFFGLDLGEFTPTNYLGEYLTPFMVEITAFEGLVSDASQQVVSGLGETRKIVTDGFKDMNDRADELNPNKQTGGNTTPFGGYGSAGEQQSELERLINESKQNHPDAWKKATGEGMSAREQMAGGSGGFIGEMSEYVKEMMAAAEMNLQQSSHMGEQYASGGIDKSEAIDEMNETLNAYNTAHSNLAKKDLADKQAMFQEDLAKVKEVVKTKNEAEKKIASMSQETSKVIVSLKAKEVKNEFGIFTMMGDLHDYAARVYQQAMAALAQMQRAAKQKRSGRRGRAVGGMITEPVEGIGLETGDIWTFGENGNEWVSPTFGRGGATNNYDQKSNVVVNVNIERMDKDMDLQKLKPIIERAIRETHSRRGII